MLITNMPTRALVPLRRSAALSRRAGLPPLGRWLVGDMFAAFRDIDARADQHADTGRKPKP